MALNQVLAAAQVAGGGYVSIWKIVPPLLILMPWARLMTWADKDAPAAHLPRVPLNIGNLCGLVLAYALFFLVPSYFIALPILLIICGAEAGVYLYLRKEKVGLGDLRKQFDEWLRSFQKKKATVAVAGQVMLFTKDGKPIPIPDNQMPERVAYDATQSALTEPLKKNSEQIDLDGRGETGTAVKYIVDSVSYAGRIIDSASGAAAIGYMKGIAGLDVEDRRKPQKGTLRLTMDGQKHEVNVKTAGSTAGEYMRLLIDPKKRHDFQLNQLGFQEKQLATIKESIAENAGVVLLSAPKGMGLTSLLIGVLRGHDAFLQHIQTIERDSEEDLEGITQNKLDSNATGADEFKMVGWVISQEPDVILINKIEDSRSAVDLIKYAKTGKRVYVGLRATSTFEALGQWRKLVGDDNLAIESLKMVVNERVLRKLCINCKVAYAPDPGTLKKMGMNPEKVTQLFQARTTPQRDQKGNPIPCDFCQDLRYKGRTGVFEIMVVDDDLRQAVIAGKPIEPVFRKQRGRFLQEESLALVEKGETSVQEVKRVLRPDSAPSEAAPTESAAVAYAADAPVAVKSRPQAQSVRNHGK